MSNSNIVSPRLHEPSRAGECIEWEVNSQYCRDTLMVAESVDLDNNELVGLDADGAIVALADSVDPTDPIGVLFSKVTTDVGDNTQHRPVIVRSCILNRAEVNFKGVTGSAQDDLVATMYTKTVLIKE